MTDLKILSLRVAALKALADRVGEEHTAARADLMQTMLDVGADSSPAKLPDGTKVAKVSLVAGRVSAYVADRRAFLGWVKANRPDEVEERVRPAYEKAVLDEAKRTGEMLPGVDLKDGTPYTTCRFDPDGEAAIVRAWRDSVLELGTVLREIEAP